MKRIMLLVYIFLIYSFIGNLCFAREQKDVVKLKNISLLVSYYSYTNTGPAYAVVNVESVAYNTGPLAGNKLENEVYLTSFPSFLCFTGKHQVYGYPVTSCIYNIEYDKYYKTFKGSVRENNNNGYLNATFNANFEILPPPRPYVDLGQTSNAVFVDTTSYVVCNCSCDVMLAIDYATPEMRYKTTIYDGDQKIYEGEGLKLDRSIFSRYSNLTEPKNISLEVEPFFSATSQYYGITFQKTKRITLIITPKSEFSPLKSGRYVDIYPKYNVNHKQKEGWFTYFDMSDVVLKEIQKKEVLGNVGQGYSYTYLPSGGSLLSFSNLGDERSNAYVLRAQVVLGDKEISKKYCYAEEDLVFPSFQDSVFSLTIMGSSLRTADKVNYYPCSYTSDSKVVVSASRGKRLKISKRNESGVESVLLDGDISYDAAVKFGEVSYGNDSPIVSYDIPVSNSSACGNYTVEYTDIAGTVFTRRFTVKGQPAAPALTPETSQPQLCASKSDGMLSYKIADGYSLASYSFAGSTKALAPGASRIEESSLSAGSYSISSIQAVHTESGCPVTVADIPVAVGKVTPEIAMAPSLPTFTLGCSNATQSVSISTTNDSRLNLFEELNGTESSIPPVVQRNLSVGTYTYRIKYEGCNDVLPTKTVVVQKPSITTEKETVVYNQVGEPYAYITIPYSNPLPTIEKWKVVYRENQNGASIVTQDLINLVSDGKIRIPVATREDNSYKDYVVSVNREGCNDKFTLDQTGIPITGRLSFSPPERITEGIASCSCKITATATSGSGRYVYYRKKAGALKYDTYIPNNDPFDVGTYTVYAKDETTLLTTDPVTVVVGVENPLSVTVDNIAIGCFGYDAKVTARKQGGGSSVTYTYPGLSAPLSYPSDGIIALSKQAYSSFTPESKILFTDSFGCAVAADRLVFSEPTELIFSIDEAKSNFLKQCSTSAKAVVLVGTASPILPLRYCYAVGSTAFPSVTCYESNELYISQTGNVRIYVTDANGCKSAEAVREVTSGNVKLVIDNATVARVTARGKVDATVVLRAERGVSPYRFACVRQGAEVQDGDMQAVGRFTLGAGTYDAYVIDGGTCTDKSTITILNPFDGLNITTSTQNNPQCNGSISGAINVAIESDPTMKLKRVLLSNLNTGRVDSVAFADSQSTYSFSNLAPGSYSISVRNEGKTLSDIKVVALTEYPDVAIAPFEIDPLFGSVQGAKTSTTVKFKLAANGNSISKVEYKDASGWHLLVESETDAGQYSFEAQKGGVYPIRVTKCAGLTKDFNTDINVLAIPMPNFKYNVLHPTSGSSYGNLVLNNLEDMSDTRYEYKVVIKKDGDPSYFKEAAIPSASKNASIGPLEMGSYTFLVSSICKGFEKGKANSVAFTVNEPLQISLKDSRDYIKVCSKEPAAYSQLNDYIQNKITVSGGLGSRQYTFIAAIGGKRFDLNQQSMLPAGSYFVEVKDGDGTVAATSSPLEIKEAAPLAVQVVGNLDLACFESTSKLQLIPTGGWGSYSVDAASSTAAVVTNGQQFTTTLGRGTSRFAFKDGNGCTGVSEEVILTSPEKKLELTLGAGSRLDLECDSGNSGKAILSADGGNTGYTYSYTTGSATTSVGSNTIEGLAPGTYTFTVKDSKGCEASLQRSVTTSFIPQNSDFRLDTTSVTCKGGSNGTLTLVNASDKLTYALSNGAAPSSSGVFENLPAGKYQLVQANKDKGGCPVFRDVEIKEPSKDLAATSFRTVPTCKEDGKGSITFTASGGNGGWYAKLADNTAVAAGAGGTISLKSLTNKTHSFTLYDAKGCSLPVTREVGNLSTLADDDFNESLAHACGGANGSISLLPKDETRTQSWQLYQNIGGVYLERGLSSTQPKLTEQSLAAGLYKVKLTDDETRCIRYEREITLHPAIQIVQVAAAPVTCKGGRALVTVEVAPTADALRYYYRKSGDAGEVEFNPATDKLEAGDYTLTVKTGYCSASQPFSIQEPQQALSLELTPRQIGVSGYHIKCVKSATGAIDLDVAGGWGSYSLTVNGSPRSYAAVVDGLTAGNTTIRVTDDQGCSVEKSVTLVEPAEALALVEISKNQVKEGSVVANTVVLTPKGGAPTYSLELLQGSTNIKKFAKVAGTPVEFAFTGSGEFIFALTDTLGCQVKHTATLDAYSQFKFSRTVVHPTCFGGNDGKLTISGGGADYRYTLTSEGGALRKEQQGDGTITGLTDGTYSLVATDNVFTEYFSIQVANPAKVGIQVQVDSSCSNRNSGVVSISLKNGTGSNAYTITLTPSEGSAQAVQAAGNATTRFADLAAGTYTVAVANDNASCTLTDSDSYTLNVFRLKPLNPSISSIHYCGEEKGKVVGSFAVGTHSYTVELLRNETSGWKAISSTAVGGSVSNVAPEVSPGAYRFRTTDKLYSCVEQTESVTVYPSPKIAQVTVEDEVCFGQKGTLKVLAEGGSGKLSIFQGQAEYERIFNNTAKLSPGQYKLLVHDDTSGCSVSHPLLTEIKGPSEPLKLAFTPSKYGSYGIDCHSNQTGSVAVAITGGGSLLSAGYKEQSFRTRAFSVSNLGAGWHRFTASDSFGCTVTDSIPLAQPDKLVLAVADSKLDLACDSSKVGYVALGASGGSPSYKYAINKLSYGSSTLFGNLGAAPYTFKVEDANGCRDSLKVEVTTRFLPFDLRLDAKNVSCYGANDGLIAAVAGSASNFTYRWKSDGSTGAQIAKLSPGTYGVTATTPNGCAQDLYATITQPEPLTFTVGARSACPGEVNGLVSFDAAGGTKPYTYLLNDQPYGSLGLNIGAPYGIYVAKVVDANGCSQMQPLEIGKKEGTVSPNFLVATTSATSDTLALIDISTPKPDFVRWDLSNGGQPIRQVNGSDERVPLVLFDATGTYQIVMVARYGECEYTISKQVVVKDGVLSDGEKTFVIGANGIKSMTVYPNPTLGKSRLKIELYQENDALMTIYDMRGRLIELKTLPKGLLYEGEVDLSHQQPGTYIVRIALKNKKDYREVKMIVQ